MISALRQDQEVLLEAGEAWKAAKAVAEGVAAGGVRGYLLRAPGRAGGVP